MMTGSAFPVLYTNFTSFIRESYNLRLSAQHEIADAEEAAGGSGWRFPAMPHDERCEAALLVLYVCLHHIVPSPSQPWIDRDATARRPSEPPHRPHRPRPARRGRCCRRGDVRGRLD